MSKLRPIFIFIVPALTLLFLAFWLGSQPNIVFALTGFLSCFLISVTLLIEGWKKFKNRPEKE